MAMDAAPKTQSYMSNRMNYKPGKSKAYSPKGALDRAKERAKKAEEDAEKAKEDTEASAEKSLAAYKTAMQEAQNEQDNMLNYYLKCITKQYLKEQDEKSVSREVSDDSNVGGSATLKGNEKKYQAYIDKYAAKYNLDPNLVASVISIESTWNPNAKSTANCKGLMQVNATFVKGNLYDPEYNIEQGCKILRESMNAYPESLEHALTAYNYGVDGAKNKSTSKYATDVLAEYDNRKQLAQNTTTDSGSRLNYQA